jgi:hypothetical protein
MALFEDLKIDLLNPQFMLGSVSWMPMRSTDGGKTWVTLHALWRS